MIELELTKRTDPRLLKLMRKHYSKPKGFVGRNICYAIVVTGVCYGYIVGGSAVLFLRERDKYFRINKANKLVRLNKIINNVFFHIEKVHKIYPTRNFAQKVLKEFRHRIISDWKAKYGNKVIGFESLVELPRTGECYRRDGWLEVMQTIGYTCKRTKGQGTDSWSGKRVWNTTKLRPKRVFVRRTK